MKTRLLGQLAALMALHRVTSADTNSNPLVIHLRGEETEPYTLTFSGGTERQRIKMAIAALRELPRAE